MVDSTTSSSSSIRSLMTAVVCASEKAASIARACRAEKDLFQMLIQEKEGQDKNEKFAHDFKTLADVLIQETVRRDLGDRYPALRDSILGEESNTFTNTLGESIKVEVRDGREDTARLLRQVLDDSEAAADILARHVHSEMESILTQADKDDLSGIPGDAQVAVDNLGIWIDPIGSYLPNILCVVHSRGMTNVLLLYIKLIQRT